jgi:hypothetical protein
MANRPPIRSSGSGARISPEPSFDVDDPSDVGRGPSFVLQTIMEIQKANGILQQSIISLNSDLDRKLSKLDKIDDIRIDIVKIQTEFENSKSVISDIKQKTDKIHNWVIGAAAIAAFLVVAVGVGVRLLPLGSAPAGNPAAVQAPTSAK